MARSRTCKFVNTLVCCNVIVMKTGDDPRFRVYLAEYEALQASIRELEKRKDNLRLFSLAVSGALFSFSIQNNTPGDLFSRDVGLYLIAPITLLMGAISAIQGWTTHRLHDYIRYGLSKKVMALIQDDPQANDAAIAEVFPWETIMRARHVLLGNVMDWFVNLGVYVLPGLIAQGILVMTNRAHRYPYLLALNWCLLGMAVLWKCARAIEISRIIRTKAKGGEVSSLFR